MRVLLDESLPKPFKKDLKGCQVKTVPESGWQGKKNGELLKLMEGNFDVFITADTNLQYQINLRNATIPILVLISPTNRYQDIKKLTNKVLKKLNSKNFQGIHRIS